MNKLDEAIEEIEFHFKRKGHGWPLNYEGYRIESGLDDKKFRTLIESLGYKIIVREHPYIGRQELIIK